VAADFDAILDSIETQKGPRCSVCLLLDDLDSDPNLPKIEAAITSNRLHAHIARALAAFTGDQRWASRSQAIARHRRDHTA
jgi:hypothetical protein